MGKPNDSEFESTLLSTLTTPIGVCYVRSFVNRINNLFKTEDRRNVNNGEHIGASYSDSYYRRRMGFLESRLDLQGVVFVTYHCTGCSADPVASSSLTRCLVNV